MLQKHWLHCQAALARARAPLAPGLVLIAVSAGPAQADLVISRAATTNVSCSGNVCMATAADAVLNVSTIESMLASSNVTVATGDSAADIDVVAAVSWAASSTLTLDAHQGISVNRPIAVAGGGGMALVTNDGGSGGTLGFGTRGRIAFLGTSNALTIDGASYKLASNIATLAADIAADPHGKFALSTDYNAAPDGTYKQAPIPTTFDAPFTGAIEGLGNTISHLTIDDTSASNAYVGLIAVLADSGNISDLRLSKAEIQGVSFVGGIAGLGYGTSLLRGDSVSGKISSTGMNGFAGGIAGGAAIVANSSSDADVTVGDTSEAGGLAGTTGGPVTDSHATGRVTAGENSDAGGLIGYAGSTVADSSAAGAVTGAAGSVVGGLVGVEYKSIVGSHATGTVHGESVAGGLVGAWNSLVGSYVRRSYATGTVSGGNATGGLIGNNTYGSVDQAFATGAVTGGGAVGGLVGSNGSKSSIRNSYATGAVTGGSSAGGFVGNNSSAITDCYATGKVSGAASSVLGGFAGVDTTQGGISRSLWDTDTSGISDTDQGAGNIADDPGIVGRTTSQLQSRLPAGFSAKVWGETAGINGGFPYLLHLPPP